MPSIFILFIVIFFDVCIFVCVLPFLRRQKLKKYKDNALSIFSKSIGSDVQIINNTLNTGYFLEYLKSIHNGKTYPDIIIELTSLKDSCIIEKNVSYLKFDHDYGNLEFLQNPEKNNYTPKKFSYYDIKKVILDFKSFIETRGSGRNSNTCYYNQYIVKLLLKNRLKEIVVFNKILMVSDDKGQFESESRLIGEFLAKIFKVNLVRINGEEVSYDKLDVSIIEKLKDFEKRSYSFKQEPFMVDDRSDNFCVNELKYYNIPKMVIGIIFIIAANIIIHILLLKPIILNKSKAYISSTFQVVLTVMLLSVGFILLILIWINSSRNKIPKLKPILLIYRDKILNNLVYKNGVLTSYNEIDISKIEEVDVRYESSLGYSIMLVSDEKSYRIASFMDQNKSDYLKDEILSIIKRLNER